MPAIVGADGIESDIPINLSGEEALKLKESADRPWKYQMLADEMMKIHEGDQYNDCYGRGRMYLALQQRKDAGKTDIDIPCEATVRKVMVQIGLIHKPRRKPNGITKADRLARKSDDLLRRDFYADRPLKKAVTDISEVKAKDGRLYVSVIFDCFDLMPLGIAIEDNMRASLCCHTLENANKSYPDIKGGRITRFLCRIRCSL